MQFIKTLSNKIINKSKIDEISILDYNNTQYVVILSYCDYNCHENLFIGSQEECVAFINVLNEDLNK